MMVRNQEQRGMMEGGNDLNVGCCLGEMAIESR